MATKAPSEIITSLSPSKVGVCKSLRTDGEPCKATPQKGSAYCYFHDPRKAKERAEARKRGGINRLSKLDHRTPRQKVTIKGVRDVLGFLEEAIADVLQDPPSQQRAKTLAYVGMSALKALEVGELEARIEALEERAANSSPIRRIK